MKPKYLVADTAAFVKNVPLWDYGEEVLSIGEVINEIRDRQTRDRLQALPIPIILRQPQPHSIKFVNEFSKKTGDYASLSLTDIKVLALTYELEVEARGDSTHLRSEPQLIVTDWVGKSSNKQDPTDSTENLKQEKYEECLHSNTDGETVETGCDPDERSESQAYNHDGVECDRDDDTNEEEQHRGDVVEEENDEKTEAKSPAEDSDNENNDESDDEGWITPSNIKLHKTKSKNNPEDEEEEEDALVACITSDFAMQNMLKHIGLSVMGIDGKLIRRIKTFILRCHACYKTTSIMTKLFCPNCGNKTLKKVSVTVNHDGSQHIWINAKRPISTRGMKYSLPTPKGGKHGRNPLLVADQREAKHFSSKMSRKKVNPLHQDYDPDHLPFAVRDVYSRAAQLGYIGGKDHHHYYWEKRNPNEAQRRTGKKK